LFTSLAVRHSPLPYACSLLFVFFECVGDHRYLHSFPTRRSSDLPPTGCSSRRAATRSIKTKATSGTADRSGPTSPRRSRTPASRSEEHTSELQSHLNLVCRLLLEKKKKSQKQITTDQHPITSQLL